MDNNRIGKNENDGCKPLTDTKKLKFGEKWKLDVLKKEDIDEDIDSVEYYDSEQPQLLLSNSKPSVKVFEVNVLNQLSLNALINMGRYDNTGGHDSNDNSDDRRIILDSFTSLPEFSKGTVQTKLFLVNFRQIEIFCEEAEAKLEQLELKPATLYDLLCFGIQYPEEQTRGEIIALGSRYDYIRYRGHWEIHWVPSLRSKGKKNKKRILDIAQYYDRSYDAPCRFLAKIY